MEAKSSLPKTSRPAERALLTIDVTTLTDLTKHTEKEVAYLHGMGSKGVRILRDALKKQSLSFKKP